MMTLDYRIEPADYRADWPDLRTVREAVFVNEQKIPPEIEFDGIDPDCHHVIARNDRQQAIGTGRLTPGHKIGRLAVLAEWRKRGVGKALLQALIDKASMLGWTEVTTQAQAPVIEFYEEFGFVRTGDAFTVADIPHQTLRLKLQPAVTSYHPSIKARQPSIPSVEINSLHDTLKATTEIIAQTRRQLCLYTRTLEPELYGQKEIVDAFKRFAIDTRDGSVQIIVQNAAVSKSSPHPLVNLAQRLPSSFLFRMPIEAEDMQYPSAFLVNDQDGYLFRLLGDRYEGHWSPAHPERNKPLFELFDKMWQRSLPCPEFRTLGL